MAATVAAVPRSNGHSMPAWRLRRRQAIEDNHLADWLDHAHDIPWGDELFQFHWAANQMSREVRAYLAVIDRYYLLCYLLHRIDMWSHDAKGNRWLFERCREVEAEPDDHLDLWSREHYKSSIITFGGGVQEVLRDCEITIGIFSFNRREARKPLRQIKHEFETNRDLKAIFADLLWDNPERQAPKWSETEGIVVKRLKNPREATIEAHGLVEGMPTGAHFALRIYDDVVTRESVSGPEMIQKVTEARELSDNLGQSPGGREWNVGTRYNLGDTYGVLLDRGVLKPRLYPATDNGKKDGAPVFWSEQVWAQKKRKQPSQVAAQLLQNPLAGQDKMFNLADCLPYWVRPRTLNVYIMGDPSKGSPNRRSDRTAIAVVGMDANGNMYLLDGFRHRMSLAERWVCLRDLHRKWSRMPGVQMVQCGWEQYGQMTDMAHFELMMQEERYVFSIEELNWTRDHAQSKKDRVERLQPDIEEGRFFFPGACWNAGRPCSWSVQGDRMVYEELKGKPKLWARMELQHEHHRCAHPIKRIDEDEQVYDLTAALFEEMMYFPHRLSHDDLVDALSRIYDLDPVPPQIIDSDLMEPQTYIDT